ncbi:O-antigen ligase family protein [Pseudonocardia lacus]|uniref:O-antigen ligase family protein n=1 Tax=Pseudonocardia lacus TaxID=2835865 RepID=UPI001BDD64D7|nr:O-antigen ligase family protein [Pseudonocardia lacus]
MVAGGRWGTAAPVDGPAGRDADGKLERRARAVVRLLTWYPAIWAVGLAPVFWPAVAAVSVRAVWRTRLDRISKSLMVLLVALLLSVCVGLVAGYGSLDRVVGYAANVAVWAALLGCVCLLGQASLVHREAFVRAATSVGIAHTVVSLGALVLYPTRLPLPLPAPVAGSLPAGVRAFVSNKLVDESWLDGVVLRTIGTMGRPTWSGAVSALTVLLLAHGFTRRTPRGRVLAALGMALAAVNVYFSFSRATEIALGIAVVYAVFRTAWRLPAFGPLVALTGLFATGVLAAFNLSTLVAGVVEIEGAREGSSQTRGAIYAATVSRIAELPLPLLGYGLKPRQDGLVASVATHSTYLGLVFRAGLIGLLAFGVFLVLCWRYCGRCASPIPRALVLLTGLWCVLEDFDPGHLVPVFVVAALCLASYDQAVGPPDPLPRRPAPVAAAVG